MAGEMRNDYWITMLILNLHDLLSVVRLVDSLDSSVHCLRIENRTKAIGEDKADHAIYHRIQKAILQLRAHTHPLMPHIPASSFEAF